MALQNSVTRKRDFTPSLLEYAHQNRNDDTFNDVTITARGINIPANKLVLSCFSKVFEQMFKTEIKEKNCVEIPAFDGEAVKSLVDYIYTGSIDIDNNNAMNLLRAADYLQLLTVKEYCFEFLESIISADNSLETLRLAIVYKNDEVKARTQQYVSEHFDDIRKTNKFVEWSISDLMDCIPNLDRNVTKESSIYEAIMEWIKHDKDTRMREFPGLFKLVNLQQLSSDYLNNIALNEKLVTDNVACYRSSVTALHKVLKEEKIKLKESKLLSLGGKRTRVKVHEVYNLFDETNRLCPNLPEEIDCHCSVKVNDIIYCIGGWHDEKHTSNKVWRMKLTDEALEWTEVAAMNEKRYVMGATVHHDTLVVAGDGNEKDEILSSSEYYVAATNKWNPISPMSQKRWGNALVSCKDWIYALGGHGDGTYLSSVERIKNLTGSWEESPSMQKPRRWFAAVNCDNVIYAIGGQCGEDASTRTKTVERFDPQNSRWEYAAQMNIERSAHTACVMQGKIYVVGGRNANEEAVESIECYNPSLNSWNIVGETNDNLFHHSMVVL